ncbi:MAG: hypothetical protein CMC93_05685 [Flavobacteriaceae bacterium]|nr:hypothetical protein [Flavobacteriaceae bacterium]|tara:strand:+ start:1602 stop:2114 length:513 start_codon:yes stop_codon:yes gene_type:complete
MPKVTNKKRKHKASSQKCSICMETPKNKANIGCSHEFCRKCIIKWSKTENSCPICRRSFNTVKTAKSTTRIKDKTQRDEEEAFDRFENNFMTLIMHFIFNRHFQFQFYADCLMDPNQMRMDTVEVMHDTMQDITFLQFMEDDYEHDIEMAFLRITDLRHRMIISRAISVV